MFYRLALILLLLYGGGIFFITSASCGIPPLDSEEVMLNLEVGGLSLATKDYETAFVAFKRVLELEPENYQATFDLGFVFLARGDTENAKKYFRTAAELRPLSPDPHLNLGALAYMENDLELARKEFEEALKLDPLNRSARFNLSMILSAAKRQEEALEFLLPLTQKDEGQELDAGAMCLLAEIYLKLERPDDAIKVLDSLETGLEAGPALEFVVESSFLRGCAYQKKNLFALAEKEFKKALEQARENESLLILLRDKIDSFKKNGGFFDFPRRPARIKD